MRIGIDITLLGAIYTGQHFYIISLLKELIKLANNDKFFLFTYGDNGYNEFSKFKNVELLPIVNGKYKNIKRIFAEYFKLPKLIKKYNLDLFFSPAFILNIKDKKIKKIVTVHDLIYKSFPGTYKNLKNIYLDHILKCSLKYSNKIIAISNNTKEDIINYFKSPKEKIEVNYYGVDEIFKKEISREKLNEKKRKLNLPDKYFVYIGTLEPRKNIPYILQNFDKFAEEFKEYKFLIYGWKGELPKAVFETINKMKNKDNVEFRGYIEHDLLPYIYRLSQGLLFLSLYEGFGLPPVEAMASGCPVYVSKLASIPEVVQDAGIYVDVEKAPDLFEKLKEMRNNVAVINDKIDIGRKIASQFTWKRAAEQTYKLLKEKAKEQ
ncbi:glycosyltransferase family 4 protein [bacterium]|nr:glycosyltransferase family 4 protein [bacterium]